MSRIGWILGGVALLAAGSALAEGRKRRDAEASARAANVINRMTARSIDDAEFGPQKPESLVGRDVWITDKGERIALRVEMEKRDSGELWGWVLSEDGEQHKRGEKVKNSRAAVEKVLE